MGRFIVNGHNPLYGTVRVSGSKNAALPIIFASLMLGGISRIYNLPKIGDVNEALAIIEEFGAVIRREHDVTYIDTGKVKYTVPSADRVAKLRASTYLLGACLSRFGRAEVQSFGGCNFSQRPIDMHISAAEKFGATVDGTSLRAECRLHSADLIFKKKSVGATVNAILMAASSDGVSTISGYAEEPHILSLIRFLRSAGAVIVKDGHKLVIRGARLGGGVVTVPGDMIEAGTFLAASLVTGGWVRVRGLDTGELASFTAPLIEAGISVNADSDSISLFGRPSLPISAVTDAYPAFPTDLQPILSSVMALSYGGSITENVWRDRFGYLSELEKFGLLYKREGNRAELFASNIHSAKASAVDLRGGAAALLLALAAEGQSIVENAETVLRGYEHLTDKLSALGAEIIYRE